MPIYPGVVDPSLSSGVDFRTGSEHKTHLRFKSGKGKGSTLRRMIHNVQQQGAGP